MASRDSGTTEEVAVADDRPLLSWQNLLPALTCIAMIVAVGRGLFPGWGTPLWLDETYTAVIATQPSFARLIDWCLHELSGPVYYTLTWGWAHIFGASDGSLRMPSLICAVATPMLILWKGHPSRDVRLLWAVLIALWMPGVTFPSEARPYALLMLLATGQVILFYRLIEQGGRGRAVAWSSLSAISILTHYYMLPVSAIQGLLYLALRRREVARTWPAALVFIPVGMWMAVHIPFVLNFASPGVAWYPKLTLEHAWLIPFILLGGNFAAGLLVVAMVPMLALSAVRGLSGKSTAPYTQEELATAWASILAAIVVITIGFFKPTFLIRYFVPFMPGLMFGFAVWTVTVARTFKLLPTALVVTALIFATDQFVERVRHPEQDVRNQFSLERPSVWLRDHHARRLIFFWDNTTASISTPARLGEVGSYFLRRDGWRGAVIAPPIAGKKVDPNAVLGALASGQGDAIIWAYDLNFLGSLALTYPPRLSGPDSPFDCRDLGRPHYSIVTCIRR
jgi:Dolichyl-phosphate-mannose-protein mannosyltransferase